MRKLKPQYPAFASNAVLQTERMRALLAGGKRDKIFDDKFFDMVDKRRGELGKQQTTVFLLQIPIFVYLVLILAGNDVNLSFLGITAGKNLREAMVVISAGLGLWSVVLTHMKTTTESFLKARTERLAKGDKAALSLLNAGYGLDPIFIAQPTNPHWNSTVYQKVALLLFGLSTLVLMLAVLIGGIYVHFRTLLEIYRHPNFSHFATLAIIGFVALADIMLASWQLIFMGALPFKSAERLHQMSVLMEKNPEKSQALFQRIANIEVEKGLVRRMLFRPRIPKDLDKA